MAGYGATARLEPELARLGRPIGLEPVHPTRPVLVGRGGSAGSRDEADPTVFEEVRAVRAPSPAALSDRMDRLRELWSQATFYLFSPDSWR